MRIRYDRFTLLCLCSLLPCLINAASFSDDKFNPQSVAYLLQADKLAKTRDSAVSALSKCDRDLIIIDCSYDGTAACKWNPGEINAIRNGRQGRKVVAYISIGEAENYRSYWKKEWDENGDGKPDKHAPCFLNGENPDWQGNYKVRYWQPEWRQIILDRIDEIVKQDFDGIYMDIVDAFEFYEYDEKKEEWLDNRKNPETKKSYRADMVKLVKKIALHAREKKAAFLVIPQNGEQLLECPDYIKAIDGIGIEDLFTDGDKINPEKEADNRLKFIKKIFEEGKFIFAIEYGKKKNIREYSIKNALRNNMILLLADRDLTSIGINYKKERQ